MDISQLNDLSIGNAMMHEKYGIGCYGGLQILKIGKGLNEFVVLNYLGKMRKSPFRLYLPVASIDLISYIVNEELDTELFNTVIESTEKYNSNDLEYLLEPLKIPLSETEKDKNLETFEAVKHLSQCLRSTNHNKFLLNKLLRNYKLSNYKWANIFHEVYGNNIGGGYLENLVRLYFSGIDNTNNLFMIVNFAGLGGSSGRPYRLYMPIDSLHQINLQHNERPGNVPLPLINKKEKSKILKNQITKNTEKRTLATIRIVQSKFRKELIDYWQGKCAVTGFKEVRLLKASHIKPWRDCDDDKDEKRDKFNGLLLAPGLDSAFDKGYISFSEIDGSMLISDELSNSNKEMLGIVAEYPKLSKLDEKHKLYLRYHLKHVYQKWRK